MKERNKKGKIERRRNKKQKWYIFWVLKRGRRWRDLDSGRIWKDKGLDRERESV